MSRINVNENTSSEGQADIAPFSKYTFSSTICPISNFNLNISLTSKTKNDLAKEYYSYIKKCPSYTSEIFKSEIKNKTNNDLIKPVFTQIKFIGNNNNQVQFDYISLMTQLKDYKILSHIANTINNEDFLDSTNLNISALQSLYSLQTLSRLNKSLSVTSKTFHHSLGLYQQHEKILPSMTSNFKVLINDFIYQTINNVFENKSIDYQSFKNIFINNNKLNTITVSSLMLPNIIYEYQNQLYSYVPHALKNTKINNFISSPAYNTNETTFKFIPEYYAGDNFGDNERLKPTIWNYPFINVKVEPTGNMNVNSQSISDMNFMSPNILYTDTNPLSIKYPTFHKYKTDVNLNKQIMINKPEGAKIEKKEFVMSNTNKIYFSCTFKQNGYIIYNPDKIGVSCSACNCKNKGGIGTSVSSNIYSFEYYDNNNKKQTINNIGENDAPTGTFEAASTHEGQINNSNQYRVYSSTAVINPQCVNVPSRYDNASHKCCSHRCKNESAIWTYTKYDDLSAIKNNILKLGINFENENEIRNCNDINNLNNAIRNAKPFYYSTTQSRQTYEFKLGNSLNQTQINKIINSKAFTGNNKWYSSTFGTLTNDVYLYDDRFYYLVYKYFDTNYKKICDKFVSEIIDYLPYSKRLFNIFIEKN